MYPGTINAPDKLTIKKLETVSGRGIRVGTDTEVLFQTPSVAAVCIRHLAVCQTPRLDIYCVLTVIVIFRLTKIIHLSRWHNVYLKSQSHSYSLVYHNGII